MTSRTGETHGFGEELADDIAAARRFSLPTPISRVPLVTDISMMFIHTDATHEKSKGTYSEYEARHAQ